MAIPAMFLSFAILLIAAMGWLAITAQELTVRAANRGIALSNVVDNATKSALQQVRQQIASAGTLPASLSVPAPYQTSDPLVGDYAVTYTLQPYASTNLNGSTIGETQSVEEDAAGTGSASVYGSTMVGTDATNTPIAPRYTLGVTVKSTEVPDGTVDVAKYVCTLRTFPPNADGSGLYADLVNCAPYIVDPAVAPAQLAADTSGARPSPGPSPASSGAPATDTSVHSYDECRDPSGSGACSFAQNPASPLPVYQDPNGNTTIVDRSATSTQSGSVAGGAAPW